MKIRVAKKSLDAPVEALFARSRFFILADPDTLEWETLDLSNTRFICERNCGRIVDKKPKQKA